MLRPTPLWNRAVLADTLLNCEQRVRSRLHRCHPRRRTARPIGGTAAATATAVSAAVAAAATLDRRSAARAAPHGSLPSRPHLASST